VAQLARGERLIAELRQRLIGELLTGDEELSAEDALARLTKDVD
jgi:hypothetical protein